MNNNSLPNHDLQQQIQELRLKKSLNYELNKGQYNNQNKSQNGDNDFDIAEQAILYGVAQSVDNENNENIEQPEDYICCCDIFSNFFSGCFSFCDNCGDCGDCGD